MKQLPYLLAFFLVWTSHTAQGQQRYPANDSSGIAGTVPNSYLIAWSPVPGAVGYDYVVSDNPLCFSGCSGDTREAFVRDTIAVEFDLQINHRYYWIIRQHRANGDTSAWSLIYSFTTRETDFNRRMITPAPNPIENQVIRLRLDWAQNPRAQEVSLELIGPHGQILGQQTFPSQRQLSRYAFLEWPAQDLAPGRYLIRAEITERERAITDTYWLNILVP